MTTVNTSDEQILKDDILQDIVLEADGPVKTYKKIGGLINLGKTYFVSEKELAKAEQSAQA